MAELQLSIIDAEVTFGNKPLFEELNVNIHENDKICLIGKNGAGKTTLMQVISGAKELDKGKRILAPNVKIGYLEQDFEYNPDELVFDFIWNAIDKERQTEENRYLVQMMAIPLELEHNMRLGKISGGQLRRAALARALVLEPNILMLDEPTNHLDLNAIEWLENYLRNYNGSYLVVSHDKRFLENISTKVFWLDRGNIKVCPRGFGGFDDWSETLLEQEKRELERRNKIVSAELEWATKGIKARRKRNVRRVAQAKEMREKLKSDLSSYNRAVRKISFDINAESEVDTRVIAEFYNASKKFTDEHGEKTILDKFNYKIVKGDRIGILGKNGSGKTSFIKMLIGELGVDSGTVKLTKNLEVSYFDQKRQDLDIKNTLWETLVPKGGDYVNVAGKLRHVCGYLKIFMFDPKDATNLVGTLSGGQKNRLMLAKVLANPGSLLILDEPTNDLDMDTLEMLEDIISKYNGTLIVVSHDRDFLDQIVTRILAFEGDGKIESYIGGYSDYLDIKKQEKLQNFTAQKAKKPSSDNSEKPKNKISYKDKYEFENLPYKIEELENNIKEIADFLSHPESYSNSPQDFIEKSEKIKQLRLELEKAEIRWLELSELMA
jgi:ATP-binding cassette subfamily F protein uup